MISRPGSCRDPGLCAPNKLQLLNKVPILSAARLQLGRPLNPNRRLEGNNDGDTIAFINSRLRNGIPIQQLDQPKILKAPRPGMGPSSPHHSAPCRPPLRPPPPRSCRRCRRRARRRRRRAGTHWRRRRRLACPRSAASRSWTRQSSCKEERERSISFQVTHISANFGGRSDVG